MATGGLGGIRYANQAATRSLPLSADLISKLDFLAPMGITMEVFSGGQPATGPKRTGSHRHDFGNAADVVFYKDGRKLDWANPADLPVFQEIVSQAKARGVSGFGAGEGYMQPGSMHIGLGSEAVWGAGGKGANAPDWLRTAAGVSGPKTYQVGPSFSGKNPSYVAPSPEILTAGLGAPAPEKADPQAAGRDMLAGLGTSMLSDEEMLAMAMAAMKRQRSGQAGAAPQYEIKRTLAEIPKRVV